MFHVLDVSCETPDVTLCRTSPPMPFVAHISRETPEVTPCHTSLPQSVHTYISLSISLSLSLSIYIYIYIYVSSRGGASALRRRPIARRTRAILFEDVFTSTLLDMNLLHLALRFHTIFVVRSQKGHVSETL